MDPRSPHLTAAMRIPDRGTSREKLRAHSRTDSHTSPSSSDRTQDAVHIPGRRVSDAPPPLPPSRYNEELARGVDLAWDFANNHTRTKLPPIRAGSSLLGGNMQPRDDSSSRRGSNSMELDSDFERRGSSVSTIRSTSQSETTINAYLPSLVTNPPSPTGHNYRLHGERPLAQQNLSRSSQAYDQHVLSKIGKQNSPPPHLRSDSADNTPYTTKLSLQTKDPGNQRLSTNEPLSTSTDGFSRWAISPFSSAVSPGFRPTWRERSADYRKSSIDSTAAPLVLDPELFIEHAQKGNRSMGGDVSPSSDDTPNPASRDTGVGYDHTTQSEHDLDYASADTGGFRSLNLDESRSLANSRESKHGVKRRAPSPPPPPSVYHDDRLPGHYNSNLYQKINTDVLPRSPIGKYPTKYGSISSTTSSARQNSLASSTTFSTAGSSITSYSSYDRLSPCDPVQFTPNSVLSSSVAISPGRGMQRKPANSRPDGKSTSRKASLQESARDTRPSPVLRVGNHYVCECCPKKPKKFDTEAELRSHEAEKQYACQYCNNRFKNKNEAERHQSSIHLRKQSWSCAALPSYHAAFHPSGAPAPQSERGSLTDACSYCGEEFPNLPQPDWQRRLDHVTGIHKIAECNSAKKFFRADHFRQHLKHSHAGQTGKWTNMLENACLKEEPLSEVGASSPTPSSTSLERKSATLSDTPMIDADVEDTHEAS